MGSKLKKTGGYIFTPCPPRLVPGLVQITWWIVMTKKLRGHSGEKISQKSRNSCLANGGGVGAHGHLTRGSNGLSPETKYKRSKNAFAVTYTALTVVRICSDLLQLPAQSLIGSPGTLIEILNDCEILVNYKFKLNKNLQSNLYRKIPRNSNPIKISIRLCTVR